MRTLMMTGVCGVGKSTITRDLSKGLDTTWGDYADMMLEVMDETDKDKIQYLKWGEKRRIYDQVELLIAERYSKTNADGRTHILENHLSIVQDDNLVTFPVEDYEKYNMVGLVVVEATIDEIMKRRSHDPNRKRLIDSRELIASQQATNRREAESIRSRLGVPLFLIQNHDGQRPTREIEQWARSLIEKRP